jgi:hypothetical protein
MALTCQRIDHLFGNRSPHPRQADFLKLTCEEALYGGAAGGIDPASKQFVERSNFATGSDLVLNLSRFRCRLPRFFDLVIGSWRSALKIDPAYCQCGQNQWLFPGSNRRRPIGAKRLSGLQTLPSF